MTSAPLNLSQVNKNERYQVSAVDRSSVFSQRLMEMGFVPGSWVEVLYEAPLSRDPIAVAVRGSVIAMRRSEAECIQLLSKPTKADSTESFESTDLERGLV